jgi:DNA polymerase alpha subunit A
MASLLGDIDAAPVAPIPRARKRKPSFDSEPGSPPYRNSHWNEPSSDGPLDDGAQSSDFEIASPKKKVKVDPGVLPTIERMEHMGMHGAPKPFDDYSMDDLDMDAFESIEDDIDLKPVVKREPVENKLPKLKAEPEHPSWLSVYDSLSIAATDSIGSLPSTGLSTSRISALEPDGSLRFYWLDYLENDGRIHFIGKLKDKTSGVWVSCCVTVENIQRNLFLLPRDKMVEEGDDGELVETDVSPETKNLYEDFDLIRKKMGIKSWRAKPVKRRYAFEYSDVPKDETEWLKVVYGFNGKIWIKSRALVTRLTLR